MMTKLAFATLLLLCAMVTAEQKDVTACTFCTETINIANAVAAMGVPPGEVGGLLNLLCSILPDQVQDLCDDHGDDVADAIEGFPADANKICGDQLGLC